MRDVSVSKLEPCMLNMEMNLLRRWVLVKNLLELVFFFPSGGKVVKGVVL